MVQPTANDKGVKRSHLVWQHYLNSFATRGKIYGKNKETGDIFKPSTENISVSKSYYRLEEKIGKDDIFLYKEMFYRKDNISEMEADFLNQLIDFLNNKVKCFTCEDKTFFLPDTILEKIDKNALARNQEELFTFYEENFYNIYKLLLNKDASFYNRHLVDKNRMIENYENSIYYKTSLFFLRKAKDLSVRILNENKKFDEAIDVQKNYKENIKVLEEIVKDIINNFEDFYPYYFLSFFLTQNCRVSKTIKEIWAINDEIENNEKFKEYRGRFNFKNIAVIFTHAHIYRLGKNLIFKNYKIVIIENKSKIPFITSDNPIINIYAHYIAPEELQEDQMEFYYPLSPHVAILFTNRHCYQNIDIIYANDNEVKVYNKTLFDMSETFVYSIDKTSLELLKQFPTL